MDLPAIEGVLNDLPDTFRRQGPPYSQFIDSIAFAKALYTLGADGTMAQASVFGPQLTDGWLTTWGLLFGLPRYDNEGDTLYATRLTETVLAWVGTLPAIQLWLDLFAPGGSVTDNAPGSLGYTINLPAGMTTAQIQNFLVSLGRIRPVGVPFTVTETAMGVFLDTINFFDSGSRVVGDYLAETSIPLNLLIGATTLSAKLLLSTYMFSDPTLNPNLSG